MYIYLVSFSLVDLSVFLYLFWSLKSFIAVSVFDNTRPCPTISLAGDFCFDIFLGID